MSEFLDVLPTRIAGAPEHMAVDFLLLQRYPPERAAVPRFRHYEWRAPACTFGYSQKIATVREQIASLLSSEHVELCRRPTGGGIVDHREDWTYALVIPRGHPLEELRAAQSYRAVHEALADALGEQGVDARIKPCEELGDDASAAPAGVCFQRAEVFDVVHGTSGAKIAGAAQKRNKHGLLMQGSIWRPAVEAGLGPRMFDWDVFEEEFVERIARMMGVSAQRTGWPEINDDEVSALTEQYASSEWIEHR